MAFNYPARTFTLHEPNEPDRVIIAKGRDR